MIACAMDDDNLDEFSKQLEDMAQQAKRDRIMREDNHKFAFNEDSGAYVFKADAMPRRFDNSYSRTRPGMMLLDNTNTIGQFGNREWFEEQRLLSEAYTRRSLGFKAPKKSLCRVYGDEALKKWVEHTSKMPKPEVT